MQADELRDKFIKFFQEKKHKRIKSASLIPENDPTILFTTAGMHPLVPYLRGEKHPLGKRLVGIQKCVRTDDIEEVGDHCHLTFFEMLGNWSLGDYFKKEAIYYSYEFLTNEEWLNLFPKKLAISVFKGDNDAPFDKEAYQYWKDMGIPDERIAALGKDCNWWGPAGETGPCGPDTEMFYWTGDCEPPEKFDPYDERWVEIWNDVFMEYNKTSSGDFTNLSQKNVDTGMGLERVLAILQDKSSHYQTDLFLPLFRQLDNITENYKKGERTAGERIIVEHLRAAAFMIADGISPSNVDQGYILRRIIRRAIREAGKLGIKESFTFSIASAVIENYSSTYPELNNNRDRIREELNREEEQFAETLKRGTKEFEKLISKVPADVKNKIISGRKAFHLYETYGFPIELTEEMAKERGFKVDKEGFNKAFKKHQEISRQGAQQKFKGGLADNSEKTTALHTATHLLHEALRRVLGQHVIQQGSNITVDRLRFDFSHPQKMTKEEIKQVEDIVNDVIKEDYPVNYEEMDVNEAMKNEAIGIFGERYSERVKVYKIGDFSKEICGGPHVESTGKLGTFKIKKEESSSRGVRRIKAILY